MACLGSNYKKARELFGVQNNYGKMTQEYEHREAMNLAYNNYLREFSNDALENTYSGSTPTVDKDTRVVLWETKWYLIKNSSEKTNNGLTCVVKNFSIDSYTRACSHNRINYHHKQYKT